MRALRLSLMAYGVLNAALYAGLTPLWEGWDEPFHYAYVQEIARSGRLPQPGRTAISREIWDSLDSAPIADGVRKNIRRGITFGEYYRLPAADRAELRRRIERLEPRSGLTSSQPANYEAHQPPLAYLILAPFDVALQDQPLARRIFGLRLVCGVAAVLLTGLGTLRLARALGLLEAFAYAAVFLVFSSQMFYATTAHIANDWLAAPLFAWVLVSAMEFYRKPRARAALLFGVLLGAALMTKAYFLSVIPLAVALAVVVGRPSWPIAVSLAIAGPWYLRNLVRGNLSGMQETARGAPIGELVRAALRVPWLQTAWSTAHSALWTGNNSYLAFSSSTLAIMLALLAVATVWYARHARRTRFQPLERVALGGLALMTAGLTYATVVFFWASSGAATTPAPWYWQALWAAAVVLWMLGLSDGGRVGRWVARGIIWVWTYAIAATYLAKLIPYYAGLSDGSMHLADIGRWRRQFPGALDTAALLPPGVLLALAIVVAVGAAGLAVTLSLEIRRNRDRILQRQAGL